MFKRLFLALALIFSLSGPVRAEGEFGTDYQVTYAVDRQGLTHVTMAVELTNRLSNIYASEFTVSIGSTNLENIGLKIGSQSIEPRLAQGNKTTNITVVFPEKILGKDKSQQFTIEFSSRDFARRLGQVWEVTVPRLAKVDSTENYRLKLAVPQSFGSPSLITPKPTAVNSDGQTIIYDFKTEDLYENGIAATFGSQQSFVFKLNYYLNNPYFYPIETEIALPPDTAWQQVLYQSLEPAPLKIELDADGNWLAAYRLNSQQNLTVSASGSARLFLTPRPDYPEGINESVDYLQTQQYWEADQSKIKTVAEKLTSPREIYQYVVENLIYDYGRLGQTPTRLGAANALDNQDSALCLEFTDLFIALARASGIPARAANGFAYTDNASLRPLSLKQDILHAWPEYFDFDRQLWIPVDPTWGNTTGGVDFFSQPDLNHFTFSIQGKDSRYPIPAGGYKNNQDPVKSVFVDFGAGLDPVSGLDLEFKLPREALAGVNLTGELVVTNSGNIAQYRVPVSLESKYLALTENYWEIPILPPGARISLNFSLPASSWNSRFTDELRASAAGTAVTWPLAVAPAYSLLVTRASLALTGLILFLLLGGLTVRTVLKWK